MNKLIDKLADKTLSFETIKLKNGGVAKVSWKHYGVLSKYKWNLNVKGYAVTGSQSMHRMILELENLSIPEGWQTDHINGDILDNRLENLRGVTPSQNHMNQKKTKGNSIYKGVSKKGDNEKRQQEWLANIKIDGKSYNLGRFYSEQDAAEEYDRIAKFLYGEYALLNFPKERHPILIGDVLEALHKLDVGTQKYPNNSRMLRNAENKLHLDILIELWFRCGFTRSLQEIAEDVEEYHENCVHKVTGFDCFKQVECGTRLKPEATNLFKFLNEIFDA